MKKFFRRIFASLALAALLFGSADARQLNEVQVSNYTNIEVSEPYEAIELAFALAQKHYADAFGGIVADYPKEVVFVFDADVSWLGCYGMACVNGGDYGSFYSDQKLIYENPVFINLAAIIMWSNYTNVDPDKVLVFVLAHEIGHHLLSTSNYPLDLHHRMMACGPDDSIDRALGLGWPTRCGRFYVP